MIRLILPIATILIAALPIFAEPHAVLDVEKLPPRGETLVWSPLFQASWDKLNLMHGGKPEKVVPPNALIANLDDFQWREDEVMPKDGYVTFAGRSTPEFFKSTAIEIKRRFGVEMTPSRLPSSPRGIAIYSILLRDLNFEKKFFRSKKQSLDFKDRLGKVHKVQFFGTIGNYSGNYGSSVKVINFKDHGKSFVLSIATDRSDESLIIYRPDQAVSFAAAIEHVKNVMKSPFDGPYGSFMDGALHKNDTVKIPYITLKTNTDFTSQLQGNRYYSGETRPWRIALAYQITHFELFEKGARIRVETGVGDEPFGEPPAPRRVTYIPRNFVCDEPFFVFAWREKAKWPYFATWIDGKEALKMFPQE